MKAYVLGGGLSGISAAYFLTQHTDWEVTIFEKRPFAGGLTATIPIDNAFVDLSPHCFRTFYKDVADVVKKLTSDLQVKVEYSSKIYLMDRLLNYPPELTELLKSLPLSFTFKVAIEYAGLLVRDLFLKDYNRFDTSYEDWLRARVGNSVYKTFFEPITQKTWHPNPNELHYTFASNRVPLERPLKNLRNMLKPTDIEEDHPYAPFKDYFYYFKGGTAQIVNRMLDKIQDKGGRLILNAEIKRLALEKSRVKMLEVDTGNEKQVIEEPDVVINTLPLNRFIQMTNAPNQQQHAAKSLQFSSLILVYILIEQETVLPAQWIFYPQKDIIFSRLSKNFHNSLVPKGHTVITAEVPCRFGDALWNAPKEEIIKRTISDLTRVVNISSQYIRATDLHRYYAAYPIYLQDYLLHRQNLLAYIDQYENLFTLGRQGEFDYINMDECIHRAAALVKEKLK